MKTKPIVKLVGTDGNSFAILAACQKSARKADWGKSKVDAFIAEAMDADYGNLLRVVCKYFEVE